LFDLEITPFHPIKVAGAKSWQFPINVPGQDFLFAFNGPVYNLVLEKGGVSVTVDGIQCVTLAHGLKDDQVVEHAYFGTHAIVDDLKNEAGFAFGFVEYAQPIFEVSPETGLVCKVRNHDAASSLL